MKAPGLRKVVLVPEGSVEGLRQFPRELCRRPEARATLVGGRWRRLSPSAELMIVVRSGARCAIRDTRVAGGERYHWTVTVVGEPAPVAAGRTGEPAEARSHAEKALHAYAEYGGLASYRSGAIG